MTRARRALHALIVVAAFFPWCLGVALFGAALWLTLIADRLWPEADHGNCWSFVGPRWFRHGGYIGVRLADDVRVAGKPVIPHAIWVTALPEAAPGLSLQQTKPIKRSRNRWFPWRVVYFPFTVSRHERPHNADD